MTQQLTVGFVGAGLIAASHARGLATVPGVRIGAVHDTDGERAAAFALNHAGSLDAVAADSDEVIAASDVVYVCTWTAAHLDIVVAAATAGRAVFCEKPLAVDLAGAEAMNDAVAAAGVTNQVGLVLRHSPAFRLFRHRLLDDASGRLMTIVFRDDQYLPTQGMYGSTWRGDRTLAGAGTLLEHSIHDLDLLRWILGPLRSVSAATAAVHGLDGIEDLASVLLIARSGAQATLTSVWHDVLSRPSQRRVEGFNQAAVTTLSGDWAGPVRHEAADGAISELSGDKLTAASTRLDGLGVNPDAEFIAAVRAGRPAYPDFAVALEAHRIADAAYRSASNDAQPVDL